MKIISWNLRNIGQNKLYNTFSPAVAASGVGNNVLEYMTNVVMCSANWAATPGGNPADLFVIIELKSGGHNKSALSNGTSLPTLADIVGALNTVAANRGITATYQYNAIQPLVTGRHECVGMIFNTRTLAFTGNHRVCRDNNNYYINPRSPYTAEFSVLNTPNTILVTGIHAPPPSGRAAIRYKPPVSFANKVETMPTLALPNQMVMGDYNCNPSSSYDSGGMDITWSWPGYATLIPDGTLSSVRQRVVNANPPPSNYLNDAYDNLLYNFNAGPGAREGVLDTIGSVMNLVPNAPGVVALLNAYNRVSDHLPVYLVV